ncbi:class II SORL domain-containing protein [Oceanidesulfovibrio marinus]|uniref:Neelaredoxin n=1 Tax=Oceanidesulfovibrio marinus TaxID=370038 RepID=A0A6P1ZET7_9BACT|nr:class II SORL domain-containing protein [Oceanidesulfovibrio marinus]QJT09342.1 Neelaredoxin [Oceanidesulfovibrio marinus]TVM32837.1 Neelaredoxin [Oceanidesulfovibrio marinus]
MKMGELFKTDDWKTEKHVPVIECPESVPAGEMFDIKVTLGKEVAHPNTTEHHIQWINVYFMPDGGKAAFQIGAFEFSAHGQDAKGPNEGPVYTHHGVTFSMKTSAPGTVVASAYCNIHGLWENSASISLK